MKNNRIITKKAPAKITLCIDVLRKTAEGFHELAIVFVEHKSLFDTIKIKPSQHTDKLSTVYNISADYPQTKITDENILLRTLKAIKKQRRIKEFVEICLIKRIPVASGLGGGSSDAGALIKGLNEHWSLKMSEDEMRDFGATLGKDIPFFIEGRTALGTGFGHEIAKLPDISSLLKIKVLNKKYWANFCTDPGVLNKQKPGEFQKTKSAFDFLNLTDCGKNTKKTERIIKAIFCGNLKMIKDNIHNDFLNNVMFLKQKTFMRSKIFLAGAGPAVYTIQF